MAMTRHFSEPQTSLEKPGNTDEWLERSQTNDLHDDQNLATAVALAASYEPGSAEEKRLLRKLDFRIIPCLWTLFLLNFIDRANIGNAKTGGLQKDFNLTSDQYSIVLLIFFASYVIFEIPSNLILVRVRPSLYLPGICFLWGIIAALSAACTNWKELAGVRLALGVIEAGFAPGATFYLSSWYRRYEISSRFSFYYTAISIAGALSGLLAGVITEYLDGARGIAGWRWLFIIEGVASCAGAIVIAFFLPDFPSTSTWLTPDERLLCAQRLAYDGLANTQGGHERVKEWDAVKMVVKDWRTWLLALAYALSTGSQTIQYFVPTIVGALGWTSWIGQYHTIPFYACSLVCTLTYCMVSDRFQNKPHFISLAAVLSVVFFIITVACTNHIVQYVFAIFAFGNVYGACALVLTWVPNIISSPAEKRAVAIALVNGIGNSASIYGVFLWPSKDAPRYIPGFSATIVWMALLAVVSQVIGYLTVKYPIETQKPEDVVAEEIRKQQREGIDVAAAQIGAKQVDV